MNAIINAVDNVITAAEFEKMDILVSEFNRIYKKCALDHLEMGRIALEAKLMGKGIYAMFCERVFMKGDAEMSKLIALGKNYGLMKRYLECLPSKWTTLYNLTRLTEKEFETFCDSGRIHPGLTGYESLELLGKAPERVIKKIKIESAVDDSHEYLFSKIGVFIYCETAEKAKEIKTLIQLAIEDGLKVCPSSEYESYEESVNDNSLMEAA